ncbi:MAG: hypothetical protein UY76_C0015G0012 [Candidatus Uhrbacteria bacterium GW2011_GWA2_52_8d]|uniref:RNA ligase domain-containing protein n=1 Tax=Candidatus Uhrbacteria bacterium GW2011_GWA2_52_8d TaxID=1618979 RepID=A0A0G1XPK2_9BACT|nr:MAG: hypothetical protein UY76_C0015G0012 [Candidatus Uhrbacteria bacterium GW2011_GWA2_52_8d]
MESAKYGRTPHLPNSPGGTHDDQRLETAQHFVGRPIVLLEKMDGGNWCITRAACWARSHSGNTRNPIFDPAKALWSQTCRGIDEGVSVFGEWLYYRHSIAYSALPAPYMLFNVRNDVTGVWDSWEDVELQAAALDLPTVPVLWQGIVQSEDELLALVERFANEPSACGGLREGVVVRLAGGIAAVDWGDSIAKWVRKDHIQRDPSTRERNGLL